MYLNHDHIAEDDLFNIDYSPETKYRICTTLLSSSDSESSQEILINNTPRGPGKRLIQAPPNYVSESIKKEEKTYRADAVFYFRHQRAVTFFEAKSERFTNVNQFNQSLQQCVCYAFAMPDKIFDFLYRFQFLFYALFSKASPLLSAIIVPIEYFLKKLLEALHMY